MNLMDSILFPIFLIWLIALVFSFFRAELETYTKLISLLIYIWFLYLFQDDLILGFARIKKSFPKELVSWIYGFSKISFVYLIIAWPISLIRIFFSAAYSISKLNLLILISYTIFYFLMSLVYSNFQVQIDNFFKNFLVQFLTI